jgi:hypothetical protein
MPKKQTKDYLQDEKTKATVLVAIAVDVMTEDFFEYEIETAVDTLENTFNAKIPSNNVDKLQAMQTIYTTNLFHMSIPAFLAIVDALNNHGVEFEYADIPSVEDVAWAVVEALTHVPDAGDDGDLFHPDIVMFVTSLLNYEGFNKIPDSLDFVTTLDVPSVAGTFMEDPILFEGYDKQKTAQASAVDDYVQENMNQMIADLDDVHLDNRDSKSWKSI